MSRLLSRTCVLVLALGGATAGCSFEPSGQGGVDKPDGAVEPQPDASPEPDANPVLPDARPDDAGQPDASPPPPCRDWTPRPTHFDPCDLPAPEGALNLILTGTYTYDTDDAILRDPFGIEIAHASVALPGNPAVLAISVNGLLVGNVARLRVTGARPLLVASWATIDVQGTIDVSSSRTENGAGANTGTCNESRAGEQNDGGGGGGGGGGFGGDGGAGGNGSSGDGRGGAGSSAVGKPSTVRGGCPGASGGQGNAGDGRGAPGAGGGALQLTARSSIDVSGRLNAGGAGGGGANGPQGGRDGGGGGGSGGLLDIEAPTIAFRSNAIVAANGGGGGEGTQGAPARSGDNGQISAGPAQGGTGGSAEGGDGGDGGAGSTSDDGSDGSDGTRDGGDESGGGGGGGGVGYIIIDGNETITTGAVLSPQPTSR